MAEERNEPMTLAKPPDAAKVYRYTQADLDKRDADVARWARDQLTAELRGAITLSRAQDQQRQEAEMKAFTDRVLEGIEQAKRDAFDRGVEWARAQGHVRRRVVRDEGGRITHIVDEPMTPFQGTQEG
jgi:hypothetical protein